MTRLNRTVILETLREQGTRSRADLAKQLQLSPPTVSRIVSRLLNDGLVRETGAGRSAGSGRRPRLLEFNHQAGVILGVDLSGAAGVAALAALADLRGDIIQKDTIAVMDPSAADGNLERLTGLISGLLEAAARRSLKVRGIGIGAPGVTLGGPGIVTWAPSLGWRDFPLKRWVEERVGLPTFVENDVNLMALGEHWRGAGRVAQSFVCISIGTGIGAGIVINGSLYRGAGEAAGEIGYMIPDLTFLGRRYEEFGCLESMASALGMARRAAEAIRGGRASQIAELCNGAPGSVTVQHVYQAAAEGDELARGIIGDTVRYLGVAIANVAAILNPELVILGGDLPRDEALLLTPLRRLLDGTVPSPPRLVHSQLGDAAVLMGAIACALHGTSGYVFVR